MPAARRRQAPKATLEEARTALLHLVELIAAREGHGLEVKFNAVRRPNVVQAAHWARDGSRPGRRNRPSGTPEAAHERELLADEALVNDVVARLLRHRADQRRGQRNAIVERLAYAIGEAYKVYVRETSFEPSKLSEAIVSSFRKIGFGPTRAELRRLTRTRDQISTDGGPIEAAKLAIAEAVGLSEGTLAMIQRLAVPMGSGRRSFGRFVPRLVRAEFVQNLHDGLRAETDAPPALGLVDGLGHIDEPIGRILDRHAEAALRAMPMRASQWQGIVADNDLEIERRAEPLVLGLSQLVSASLASSSSRIDLPFRLAELVRSRHQAGRTGDGKLDDEIVVAIRDVARELAARDARTAVLRGLSEITDPPPMLRDRT